MKIVSKYTRKLLALAITCCLLITSVGSITASAEDVSGHWAAGSIALLKEKGIIKGDNNGDVKPNNDITRAEFVAIINRAFEFTQKSGSNFPDVKSGAWYYDDFAVAKQEGYLQGDDSGNANPGRDITRAEAAAIIGRILDLPQVPGESPFIDKDTFPVWSVDSINALTGSKLILGYPDNTFRAGGSITRAEAFTILARIFAQGLIPAKDIPDSETPQSAPSGGSSGGNTTPYTPPTPPTPTAPPAPTADELSVTLAPGSVLCSTIIKFEGTKAKALDIVNYEFVIADSAGVKGEWTSITADDLISGKQVVVESVRHYIYLRVKAAGNTPAGASTAGVQLTNDNVNLELSGDLNPYVNYNAETIKLPKWYEYAIGNGYTSEIDENGKLIGDVFDTPVSLPVGSYIYYRARYTDDLPFIQFFDPSERGHLMFGELKRMDPPPVDAVILSSGETGTNIRQAQSYRGDLEVKAVVPGAGAKAKGNDVICDWTKLDKAAGMNLAVYTGCTIYIRTPAVPGTGERYGWGDYIPGDHNPEEYIPGEYKSLPVTVSIVDTTPTPPRAPTAEELRVTLEPGIFTATTRLFFAGSKLNIEDLEDYEFCIADSPNESAEWMTLKLYDLNPNGIQCDVSSVRDSVFIRQRASGIVPAGAPTAGVLLTKDNVNLSLVPDFHWWIDYDKETITVRDWYKFGIGTDDFDGVTGQPVPLPPATSVYIRNRSTEDLPFEELYRALWIPRRPIPPDNSVGALLTPGAAAGTVNIKLSPLVEFKVVLPNVEADVEGDAVIADWAKGNDETGIDVAAAAGYRVFYRVACVWPHEVWVGDEETGQWIWDPGIYKSLPSAPYVIQQSEINPG